MQSEQPLIFDCAGDTLLGILHPAQGVACSTGMLLVVGGPQYRVGSHRQFILLARTLAAAGISVFRFDYRGMGDSSGEPREFEAIAADIRAALDVFLERLPQLSGVVLWGLCDAATANAFYALSDTRVRGQIALNPWVRTSEGEAQAFLRHYYWQRLLSRAFWRKLRAGEFRVGAALRDFFAKLRQSQPGRAESTVEAAATLPERLSAAQRASTGPTLVILSGQDLTAKEYEQRVAESPQWQTWLDSTRVSLHRLDAADHTFSRAEWRDQVAAWSRDWILERLA